MIERLMDPEFPYGEPEYSDLTGQIHELRQALEKELGPDSRRRLSGADRHHHALH